MRVWALCCNMAAENATDERQFAYGFNQYKACECPAVRAGYDPCESESVALKQVADAFDRRAQEQTSQEAGTISEASAKSIWLNLIEKYDSRKIAFNQQARIAKSIAKKLGWIDE